MDFSYICHNDKGQTYLEITGCTDASRILRVPPAIDGCPVRVISSHAFEKNEVIEQVILPDSVAAIGTFAFYGCRNLRLISLTDNAESWGTGAIYFCRNLSEIRLRIMRNRYSILRDVLADTDLGLFVTIEERLSSQNGLPDGQSSKVQSSEVQNSEVQNSEVRSSEVQHSNGQSSEDAGLYFPAYTHGFDEDTYARAFHTWIEGCGFAYRETVMRTGIAYREYDQLFVRAMADGVGGVQVAANIALARLMHPRNLRETAHDKYVSYLNAHGEEILLRLVEEQDRERAMFMLERGYVSPEAAGKAVLTAAGQGDAELVAMLMRLRANEPSTGGEDDGFELGDL